MLARRVPRKLGRLSRSGPRDRAKATNTLIHTHTVRVKSATARERGGETRAWRGGDKGEAEPKSTSSSAASRGRGASDASGPRAAAGDDKLCRPADDEAAEATTRQRDDEAAEPDANPAGNGPPWRWGRAGRAAATSRSPSTRASAPSSAADIGGADGRAWTRRTAERRSACAMPRMRATDMACQA